MVRIDFLAPFVGVMMASALAQAETGATDPAWPSNDPNAGAGFNWERQAPRGAPTPNSRAPTLAHRTIHDRDNGLGNRICSNC
jgi:hypothetical protein